MLHWQERKADLFYLTLAQGLQLQVAHTVAHTPPIGGWLACVFGEWLPDYYLSPEEAQVAAIRAAFKQLKVAIGNLNAHRAEVEIAAQSYREEK